MLKFDLLESLYHISLDVKVRQVQENNFMDFIFLPYRLYAQDENWLPPLSKTRMNMLNIRVNTFLKGTYYSAYLAYRHNLPVGSIVCGISPFTANDTKSAFFCQLEAEDEEACHALLLTAQDYAKENGCNNLAGPLAWDGVLSDIGVNVNGLKRPGYLNGCTKKQYAQHLESAGFEPFEEYATYIFDLNNIDAGPVVKEIRPLQTLEDIKSVEPAMKNMLAVKKNEFKHFNVALTGFTYQNNHAFAFGDIIKNQKNTKDFSFANFRCNAETCADVVKSLLFLIKQAGAHKLITAPIPAKKDYLVKEVLNQGGEVLNTYRVYQKKLS